nr:spore coat protein [uncultured Bacillus sp.]
MNTQMVRRPRPFGFGRRPFGSFGFGRRPFFGFGGFPLGFLGGLAVGTLIRPPYYPYYPYPPYPFYQPYPFYGGYF